MEVGRLEGKTCREGREYYGKGTKKQFYPKTRMLFEQSRTLCIYT